MAMNKKLLLIAVGCTLIGIALTFIGALALDKNKTFQTELTASYEANEIHSLNFEMGLGEVEIIEGDQFYVESTSPTLKSNVKNGVWHLDEDVNTWNFFKRMEHYIDFGFDFNDDNEYDKTTITIPKDFYANKIEFDMSAGNARTGNLSGKSIELHTAAGKMSIDNLSSDNLTIESSAGGTSIENITCKDADFEISAGTITVDNLSTSSASIECDMGNMTVRNGTSENTSIEVAAGSVDIENMDTQVADFETSMGGLKYNGSIVEKATLECSAGTINLDLLGDPDSYNFKTSRSAGSIDIYDNNMVYLKNSGTRNSNNSNRSFIADCDMGKIKINFRED